MIDRVIRQLRVGNRRWLALLGCSLLGALLISPMAPPAFAQGLVYVDADDGFFSGMPNLSAGNPALTLNDVANTTSNVHDDNKWGFRPLGVAATVYEAGGASDPDNPPPGFETALEMKQTISGLAAGSYDVYVAYWTDDDEDWSIAGGFMSGQQVVYNFQGANAFFPTATAGTFAASGAWTTAPAIFSEASGDRDLLLGKVGTTTAVGGQIEVFINDPPGQTSAGRRSWFDGVAFVPAGTEVFLTAEINRTTGQIEITNNTPIDFTIRNYAVNSSFGSLDATQWETITGNPAIDPDPWTVTAPPSPATTPFATQLAEMESAGGSGGALLASGGSLNLGPAWISTPAEDVQIQLTLADGNVISPLIAYTGDAAVRGDLNGDGGVTVADYETLVDNMHTDVSTITGAEAYLRGDVTANRRINYEDFEEFVFAFDAMNGAGSFAAMIGVPEPASALLFIAAVIGVLVLGRRGRPQLAWAACPRPNRPRSLSILAACFVAAAACYTPAQAVPVTGWAIDTSFGGGATVPLVPVLTGEATNSPTLGNGTTDNARNTAIFASFPQVNLADGQQVTLTGTADFTGMTPVHGTFRFGMLFEGGTPDTFGWLGFLNENSNLQNSGNLNSKNPAGTNFATTTFASTVSGRSTALDSSRDREFQEFVDGTYDFTMTIGRFGNEVYVDSSLSSDSGFLQKSRYATESDPARLTLSYNRVGLLAGDVLATDQVAFGNIDVTTSPIETLTLEVTTSGASAGTTRIVNSLGQSEDINYYEISSASGAIDLSGWNSLDDQEGADPVGTGWDEAGGSNGLLLSETNLLGDTLANGAALDLGQAFDVAGSEDLRFFYGLADGTFVRGLVDYVAGPAGLPGDYNQNGVVDAADYTVWRDNLGSATSLPNDSTAGVGLDDYTLWKSNFGNSSPGAGSVAAAVPEPAALALLVLGVLAGGILRRRA